MDPLEPHYFKEFGGEYRWGTQIIDARYTIKMTFR
jgi:hypothetical protein